MTPTVDTQHFPCSWQAQILTQPPLILPARQFTFPEAVPGEEEALGRGALYLQVRPAQGGPFFATCALGFQESTLPTGVWSCPAPQHLLALAGGYAYLLDTAAPATTQFLPLRPVCTVLPVPGENLLLLAGFHQVLALDQAGLRWQTGRLSWEGVSLTGVRDGELHGMGWDMFADRDVPFRIDLRTGQHEGGGYMPRR